MSTLHGPPLEDMPGIGALTMSAFLEEVATRFGPNQALVFDEPLRSGATLRWTYADLRDEARRVAKGLIALGIERGDRVAVLMGNRPEAVAALFGATMAGAVAVPLSTFSPAPELAYLLTNSEAKVAFTQTRMLARRYADDLEALRPELPELRAVVTVGDSTWDRFLMSGDGVEDAIVDQCIAETSPTDHALIIYSSGTTSAPKGMLHNHRAPTLQFWVQAQIFRRHEATRMWTALPLFWTAGLNTAMGATLAAGGCWVMQESFEPGEALALMTREQVTEPYALPHQIGALEEHPAWAATDLSSLTYVFGKSAFSRHPTVEGDTTWNMPVGYGLSETCAFFVSHWSDTPRELLKQSMGRLLPGNELRVVDPDTGQLLGPGEDGELAIKGPTLMEHYVGMTPAECFDADGFFHTGDAGFFDDDGFVHWTGRRTEMIKTGGANVSPAELEVQLRACPPVKLARIVGMPDPRLDEIVVACITLKDGASATEADIQAFLRERVAAYKVPKRVLFFTDGAIPMTGSDTKVRDAELVALVAERLASTDHIPTTSGDR
ncbi:MAG: class I adenylate-forming enzyme family protein [Acidimicrobiales bacterium]